MSLAMICCSHSPLMLGFLEPADKEIGRSWQQSLADLDDWVRDYDPELIAIFYPDHFNGFFYRSMPPFCIGTVAEGGIDWDIEPGPLDVPSDIALDCIAAVRDAGIDVAVSHRMRVDHGVTVPLNFFGGGLSARPSLPILVNCNAPPLPSFGRVRYFGEAVGRYLASLDKRVLVVGSGGLSHDPPNIPRGGAPGNMAERLIEGGAFTKADYDRRQAGVIQAGRDLAAGGRPCLPPDEEWDRGFMETLLRGDLEAFDDADDDELSAVGGFGVHEVRTWTAAFAAMRAVGRYEAEIDCYHCVPEWLTGMGIMRASATGG
jgi:2,3-dihydroxyphenylpropionate 1,2-dioxygenase